MGAYGVVFFNLAFNTISCNCFRLYLFQSSSFPFYHQILVLWSIIIPQSVFKHTKLGMDIHQGKLIFHCLVPVIALFHLTPISVLVVLWRPCAYFMPSPHQLQRDELGNTTEGNTD